VLAAGGPGAPGDHDPAQLVEGDGRRAYEGAGAFVDAHLAAERSPARIEAPEEDGRGFPAAQATTNVPSAATSRDGPVLPAAVSLATPNSCPSGWPVAEKRRTATWAGGPLKGASVCHATTKLPSGPMPALHRYCKLRCTH
jgi:hypothetical protein